MKTYRMIEAFKQCRELYHVLAKKNKSASAHVALMLSENDGSLSQGVVDNN